MFDYLYLVIYRIPKAIFMALFCRSHFFYLWEMLKCEKISICKCDIFWHLMWIVFLPFGWANSIKTDWWTCNLWSNQSVSYKSVNTFDWIYPTQLAKTNLHQMSNVKKNHICKWITFHILTFHIIEETNSGCVFDLALALLLLLLSYQSCRYQVLHIPYSREH